MKNLICIFSGKSNHKWNSNKDYFKSITNHIFNMLNDYKIFIFIGCFPNEVDDWNKLFIEKMKEYNNVTINIYSDLFTQQKLLSELTIELPSNIWNSIFFYLLITCIYIWKKKFIKK